MADEEKPKTMYDCCGADKRCLDDIQDAMNLFIGHELYDVETRVFYRGHYFKISCEGKQEKGRGNVVKIG